MAACGGADRDDGGAVRDDVRSVVGMGEQHIWHDERGRRITSVRYMGTNLYCHSYRDGPDDAPDRDGVDIDAEADGAASADADTSAVPDPDTGDRQS